MSKGATQLDDGTYAHELEYYMTGPYYSALVRDPKGGHLQNGACDCGYDCCSTSEEPYKCICDECNGECGSEHE